MRVIEKDKLFKYIPKPKNDIESDYYCEIADTITDLPEYIIDDEAADVQSVDKITKIIQARLNGVRNTKINAMLSGDSNTAYKMVGAETVCIAILQDLEAIKAIHDKEQEG